MLLLFLYIFLIEQLLDCVTTAIALKLGAREINPLGRKLFETIGLDWGIILICTLKVLVVLWASLSLPIFWIGCIIGVMGIVVINNTIVIYRKTYENLKIQQ